MSWKNKKTGWAALSAAAVASALTLGAAFRQPEVTGQERNEPKTTVTAREAAPAVEQAKTMSLAFRRASELATPSVVKINAHTKARAVTSGRGGGNLPFRGGENPFKGTPFEDMIPDLDQFDFRGQVPQRDGVGSGVIISTDGLVVTNNHVVAGADEVLVKLADGREFKATDIKTDSASDLAVLRLKDAKDLPAAKLGNSDDLEIGDWVIAIGNPFELEATVSAGIISGKGRELSRVRRAKFLQTDAAINPGNSGGPLVNLNGEVVGINTAIASNNGGYQGIGFAIPSNQAKWVTQQLVDRGSVERGYLGVGVQPVTADLAAELGAHRSEGAVVAQVYPNTPAAKAGLEEGDVITKFAGKPVKGPRELTELVERASIDSKETLTVLRDGKERTIPITIKALPKEEVVLTDEGNEEREEQPSRSDTYRDKELGLEVANLTEAQQEQFGDYKGVLVRNVEPESPAARQGVRPGMLVRKVGRQAVSNVEEYSKAVKKELDGNGVLLSLRTTAGNRLVVVKPESE
jgi:serine protease Do